MRRQSASCETRHFGEADPIAMPGPAGRGVGRVRPGHQASQGHGPLAGLRLNHRWPQRIPTPGQKAFLEPWLRWGEEAGREVWAGGGSAPSAPRGQRGTTRHLRGVQPSESLAQDNAPASRRKQPARNGQAAKNRCECCDRCGCVRSTHIPQKPLFLTRFPWAIRSH